MAVKTKRVRKARRDDLIDKLSAALSKGEIKRVLAGSLSSMGPKEIGRLADKLGPATGAALLRALRSRGKKLSPAPGPAEVLQEWKRAWKDWGDRIYEACREEGKYVIQDHHWEEPYFDPTSVTDDLEPVTARMIPLLPRVFDEDLDPGFSFAEAAARCVDDIASSLPDWMGPFEQEGFCLGPKATGCLIDWEWRSALRDGKTTFDLVDKLCELEDSNEGLSLDEDTLIRSVRKLGRKAGRVGDFGRHPLQARRGPLEAGAGLVVLRLVPPLQEPPPRQEEDQMSRRQPGGPAPRPRR